MLCADVPKYRYNMCCVIFSIFCDYVTVLIGLMVEVFTLFVCLLSFYLRCIFLEVSTGSLGSLEEGKFGVPEW